MKDLAYRNFPQLAISEGDTTPNPGFPAIAHSTTLNLLTKWNGVSWSTIDDGTFRVDWVISHDLAQYVFNVGAMTLDFSTAHTSDIGPPTASQLVLLSSAVDFTKLGVYVLGSVASLSAVPITRHPDWPGDRYIRKGMRFRSTRGSVPNGSYATAFVTAAYPTEDAIDLPDWAVGWGRSGSPIARLASTGTMPGGITAGQWYWVRRLNNNQVRLYPDSNCYDGDEIDITSAGTGTITIDVAPTVLSLSGAYFEWEDADQKLNSGASYGIVGIPRFEVRNNATGANALAIGNVSAEGDNSLNIGVTGQARGVGAIAIGGAYAYGDFSTAIGFYATTDGGYSIAIGDHGYAPSDNAVTICHGLHWLDSTPEYLLEGFWHFEATTTDATQTTCYVNKLASTLKGAQVRSGYYFLSGRAVAHSVDRTKIATWIVRGTVQREGYGDDPIASIEFIPETNTGGSQELALKIVSYVIPSDQQLAFKVTGAAGTTYFWSIDLQYAAKDSYDYSAETLDLAGAKKTKSGYIILPASESITAGAPVNIWNDSGTTKVRNANASNGRQADGFVGMTYGTGDSVVVFLSGNTSLLSGLTIGPVYLGTTAGTYSSSAPGTGNLVQRLGFATTTSNIAFIREPAIQT